jgi:hypothetical protein
MNMVYENGLCNIAATASLDSYGGLFFRRSRKPTKTSTITLQEWPARSTPPSQATYDLMSWDLLFNEVSKAPLNNRGWVFQERVLASRVLHFGRNQLFWECKQQFASEEFPDQLPSPIGIETFSVKFQPQTVNDPLMLWRYAVNLYSKCCLTYQSDKLVALSGLAKYFQRCPRLANDVYIAGLWKSNLLCGLCWRTKPIIDNAPYLPLTYQYAPSWSWASMAGEIYYPSISLWDGHFDTLAYVVDSWISLASDDPTGSVAGGHIRLRGALNRTLLRKDDSKSLTRPWVLFLNGKVFDIVVHLDRAPARPLDGVFCLALVETKYDVHPVTERLVYLLLLEASGETNNQYLRVGLAYLKEKSGRELAKKFCYDAGLACDAYDPQLGYTITIV